MYARTPARPIHTRYGTYCSLAGYPKRMAAPRKTRPAPSQPMTLSARSSIGLPAPALAVDRPGRQEQTEADEAEVVDEVRGVEHALREVVVVIDDREVLRDAVDRRRRKAADPVDDPEQQEDAEGGHSSDDLVARHARDEQTERDEAAAHEEESQIGG